MKKSYSARRIRNFVTTAFTVALFPMFTCPASADDFVVSSPETASSTLYTLTGTDSLTVTSTGEVNATGGATAIVIDSSATDVSIVNRGIISMTSGTDHAAIYVDGDLSESISNSGSITITDPGNSYATLTGIHVVGDVSGSLTNSGMLSIDGTDGYSYTFYGIKVDGSLTGTLTNSGTINLAAIATDDIYLEGISIGGDISETGTLINSGTIDINGLNSDDSQSNFGINIGGDMAGALENTGNISVSSLMTSSSASENYAHGINIEGELSGTLVNSGAISAIANQEYDYTVGAYGITVGEDLSGSLTNTSTGTIDISATNTVSDSDVTAGGIGIDGSVSGSLTNDGTITVSAENTGDDIYATGIYVGGEVSGTITNNGTLNVTAKNEDSDVYATGIHVGDGVTATGAIVNSGTIGLTLDIDGDDAEAYGIYVGGDVDGSITNSGSISIDNTLQGYSGYSNTFYGIRVDGSLTGTLTNSGTINLAAIATDDIYLEGISIGGDISETGTLNNSGTIDINGLKSDDTQSNFGINVEGVMAGTLENSGTISVSSRVDSSSSSGNYAYGIYLEDELSGTLTNSGSISAEAVSGYDYDNEAIGIAVEGDLSGTLTNTSTGTISASASNFGRNMGTYATALGIAIDGVVGVDATLTNHGVITVIADNSYSDAEAYGIDISDDVAGTVVNNGTLTVTATANRDNDAYATGIYIGGTTTGTSSSLNSVGVTATGSVTNNGIITVTAEEGSSVEACGIYVGGDVAGSVTNNGTLTVTALTDENGEDAGAAGIYVDGDVTGTGSVTNNGTIQLTASATDSDVYGAAGIYIDGDVSATSSITNTGDIAIDVLEAEDNANAADIYVSGDMQGTMLNSGDITLNVNMRGGDNFDDYGVYIQTLSGIATNSGNIDVNQTVGASSSDGAYGLYVNTLTGSLVNSGTISSTGTGTDASETAYPVGLYVRSLDAAATITNSGTITARGVANASAIAVDIGTLDGTFTNSGIISASDENGSAMSFDAGSGTGSVANSGSISGDFDLGGTISLTNTGTISMASTGSVGGDYSQTDDSVLRFGVRSSGDYAQLDVGGSADISDNSNITMNVDNVNETLADADVLASVISAGTLITDTAVNVYDNSLAWQFAASMDETDLDITVSETGLTTFAAAAPGAGIAPVLDSFMNTPPTGDMVNIINLLGNLTTQSEVEAVVGQLTPILNGGGALATLTTTQEAAQVTQARLKAKRGLSSGDPLLTERNLWIKPFGSMAEQDERDGVSGYDADSYGLILGADAEIAPDFRMGMALAYAQTDMESDSASVDQTLDIDTYQVILYGSTGINTSMGLDFKAYFASNNGDGQRDIAFGGLTSTARSDIDSFAYHLDVGLNHMLELSEKANLLPSVNVAYTSIETDGYTEKGAGSLNLDVSDDTTDEFVLTVAGDYSNALSETMTLIANIGVGYDFMAEESSINSSLAGGGGVFTTDGIDPSPWIFTGGLGLEMFTGDSIEVVARYDFEGREDYVNHAVSVKFQMPF
jgi:uncharacterized protein with beta-barrel porin domain